MDNLENNRLIAEFMGYEGQHEEWCGSNILSTDSVTGEKQMFPFRPESNWNDLMPVIERISHEEMYEYDDGSKVTAYPTTFGMPHPDSGKPMFRFTGSQLFTGDTLIEVAYTAVVDWIITYNEEKEKEG